MNATTLEVLGKSILRAPLIGPSGVQYFVKTFQGTGIAMRLDYLSLTVQCDWAIATRLGPNNGVRYQIYVTGQDPATGVSCYIEDVDANTPPPQVRNALIRIIKTLAGNPQLSMANLSVVGVPATEVM